MLLLSIFVFSVGLTSAQAFRFGVKGGLNYSTLNFDEIKGITANGNQYNLQSDDAFQGFHIGVQTRIKFFNLFLQPEILFNTAGGKVLVKDLAGGADYEEVKSIKYNKIDLPVLVGVNLGPARLVVGPVASAILSSSSELNDIIPDLNTISKDATIGYQLGAGIDLFKILTLDYRYEGGLSKWGEKLKVGANEYPFDSRNHMHFISVGLMF